MDYDELSPITGNRSVLIEADTATNIESRICMESGYTTKDTLLIGSQAAMDYESMGMTEFMKAVKYDDENLGTVWYPAFIQMQHAMLYCERVDASSNTLVWKVAQVKEIDAKLQLQYPIPGKDDEYYTSRLDVENALTFEKLQFKAALDQCYAYAKGDWAPIENSTHIEKG